MDPIGHKFRFLLHLAGILLLAFISGCIESDETRSFYIAPDGRVEVVIHWDNVRSSETEKGPQELEEWFRKVKSGQLEEIKKLKETGAKKVQVTLVRKTVPYAAVVTATYDSVEAFGRLFDLNREGGEGTITLEKEGAARRLVFRAAADKTPPKPKKIRPDDPKNYYPVWKFIPVDGRITQADGFLLSEDKRSCLLNLPRLERMKRTPEGYFFFIAWNVE